MTRRCFFLGAAAAASASRVIGANDLVNVGFIGLGKRGMELLSAAVQIPGARVAALCDVDGPARENSQARLRQYGTPEANVFQDLRRLLERKDLDVTVIAAPNHWHALAAIWSCQTGKDVYVESPASHNITESLRMIEAAKKYGRVSQTGLQRRSAPHAAEAIRLLKDGAIGRVYLAKAVCYRQRQPLAGSTIQPVPQSLDWDLFLGPAPTVPYSDVRARNWQSFWDTGGGDLGERGTHELDTCRWALGTMGTPANIFSPGERPLDRQETPDIQTADFEFTPAPILYEGRCAPDIPETRSGSLFLGDQGRMWLDDRGYRIYQDGQKIKEGTAAPEDATAAHLRVFLDAVRSRRQTNCDFQTGVAAAALCHTANIAYRLDMLLAWDPMNQRFANSPEANRFLTRAYRRPFVVPDKV